MIANLWRAIGTLPLQVISHFERRSSGLSLQLAPTWFLTSFLLYLRNLFSPLLLGKSGQQVTNWSWKTNLWTHGVCQRTPFLWLLNSTLPTENWTTGLYLQADWLKATWCEHEVQVPNYTHVQEEEQKKDGPTCDLMDGAYQLLGLRLNKPEHLIIRVSLCIFIVSYLSVFF